MPRKKLKLATGNFIIKEGHCISSNIHGIEHRRAMSIVECLLADIWLTFGKNHRCAEYQSTLGRNVEKGGAQGLTGEFSTPHSCWRRSSQAVGNYFVSHGAGWKETHSTSHVFNKEVLAYWRNCPFTYCFISEHGWWIQLMCSNCGYWVFTFEACFVKKLAVSTSLLFHTEVNCLSRWKCLDKLLIGVEIKEFPHDTSKGNFFLKWFFQLVHFNAIFCVCLFFF